jgi:2-oxoglutarate ferredoxin oxidoreductase subunit alpha
VDSFSVLIGGKAGDGITQAGSMIAHLLNELGYRLRTYVDSPSLIRGGHNFVIVRAHRGRIAAHRDHINVMIALTPDTLERHEWRLKPRPVTVFDNQTIDPTSLPSVAHPVRTGIPVKTILEQEQAPSVMRNSAILGAFCKAMSIPWETLEDVIRRYQPKQTELNLRVARRGFELATEKLLIHLPGGGPRPVMTGLEATGLGLIRGGLKAYAGYPMTPASGLLHFLAREAPRFELKVVQPEGEIAAVMMALGHAYAGERAAVGTSGGGFALMVEGLSLAGQAELPIVFVLGQRPGPATGLPTYTAQGDLHFAMSAGHGEFPRLIVAPADVEQAYAWSTFAMDAAWKYQLPAIVLGDRTLNDDAQSFDRDAVPDLPRLEPRLWDGVPQRSADDVPIAAGAGTGAAREKGGVAAGDTPPGDEGLAYKRYLFAEDGISPLAFPGREGAVVKVNSYTHDEFGITTEDPEITVRMQDKWNAKGFALAEELDGIQQVYVYGDPDAKETLVTWGSPTGAAREVGELAGIRVVQPVVLWPFPDRQMAEALEGTETLAVAEGNSRGQLARLLEQRGFHIDGRLLRYDGRPWGVGELRRQAEEVLA